MVEQRFLALIREAYERQPELCQPVAGALDAVRRFRRLPQLALSIATAGWTSTARYKLAVAGFSVDDLPLATSRDAEAKVDIMRMAVARAARHYGVHQFESVVCFGDSAGDARAAGSLGFEFIGIDTSGFVADVTHRYADFSDLEAIVTTLGLLLRKPVSVMCSRSRWLAWTSDGSPDAVSAPGWARAPLSGMLARMEGRDGGTGAGYLLELMDRAPMLCFAKDRAGKYLYVNRAWLGSVGREREAVLGRTDHELFDEASADGLVENDRQVLETGRTLEVEERVRLGDRECVGHSTKFALRDAQGRVSGVGGLLIDVTARHEARRALAQSEERYRELLEHSPEAYVVLDAEQNRFVDANDNSCRMFKMSREQLLRAGPVDLSPPTQPGGHPSAALAKAYIRDALAGGTPVFDWIHQAGDGELLPCRIWLSRVDLQGSPGVRASMLDMREIERVRTALERTRAQLDAVQDALPQLVVVFDPGREALVHCNRRYRELVGDPPAPQLWQLAREACQRAMHGDAGRQEVRLSTQSGRTLVVEVDVSVLHEDEAGDPALLLLVGSDVTEQREMESQLLQSRKLESLGRLAGGVAHDFNNLLTVILGSAEFLAPALEGHESALADLASLERAAEKACALTRQLLTFAKAESGRVEAVAVDTSLGRALAMLKRLIGEDVVVETSLRAPDSVVMIDRGQLDQIVVNLAINARDAMNRGGRLRISTRPVELKAEQAAPQAIDPGAYLELCFADTGTGMSADVSERAFEPFFTTKPQGKGTGLGLSTVHGIAQTAGGRVRLESRLGEGTRVVVLLPVESHAGDVAAVPPGARRALEPRSRGGRRLLLVEDDAAVREVNARALREAGHEVVEAEGPEQALGIVDGIVERGERFDALVSDVVMPGMSGLELAERVVRRVGVVHVLFVSGYAESALAERGVPVSDVSLLRKPFSPATLVRRVDEMNAVAQ